MLIALALAALIAPSGGELNDDPDGVVTTAPRGAGAVIVGAEAPTTDAMPAASQVVAVTPHNLTTQQQIDRWISARSPDSEPFARDTGPVDDRQMHGFVSGSVGTNDYSAVSVGVSLPIGESGRMDLTYSQTKNGWLGYGYGHPSDYAYGGIGYEAGRTGFAPGYGERSRSSRSMSLGFSWDEDNGRGQRGSARAPGFTAQD